jgi:hypothetical protein
VTTTSDLVDALNAQCHCVSIDTARLDEALREQGTAQGGTALLDSHPNLFARSAVFVGGDALDAMRDVIVAIERVVARPSYVELALRDAHAHAQVPARHRGAFLGFDFHLSAEGPQLIEINTNAGGGPLNALLRRAQRACCEPVTRALADGGPDPLRLFVEMLRHEWSLARGSAPLRRIAIVDDEPASQFLYPEMSLFAAVLRTEGIDAVVCDSRELSIVEGALVHADGPIDLVYNRLTDFALADPAHAVLAETLVDDLAIVTPHPRAHALYADKLRLVTLSDPDALTQLGVTAEDTALLERHIPRTVRVDPSDADRVWGARKTLFFKPRDGYGSRAAYRGDKITRGVFASVVTGDFVAQRIVAPSDRVVIVDGEPKTLKVDIRNFAYDGRVQLVSARLYHGQTTNMRTPGGGLAPVYRVGEARR